MADGSKLPLIGKIKLQCSVRGEKFVEEFIVSRITHDAILGMSFFKASGCTLSFKKASLYINNKNLLCVGRLGDLLVSNIQVMRDTITPVRPEMAIHTKLCNNTRGMCGITGTKMNHKMPENVLVALKLWEPDGLNKIVVEDEIRAGTVSADFISL